MILNLLYKNRIIHSEFPILFQLFFTSSLRTFLQQSNNASDEIRLLQQEFVLWIGFNESSSDKLKFASLKDYFDKLNKYLWFWKSISMSMFHIYVQRINQKYICYHQISVESRILLFENTATIIKYFSIFRKGKSLYDFEDNH